MKFLALAPSVAILVAFIAPGIAPGIAANPEARTLQRSTDAGHEVRVFTYSQHKSDCSPAPAPQISMGTKPAHGAISMRPATVAGSKSRFSQLDCTGTMQSGLAVWYDLEAGFRGTDQFDYYVINGNSTGHDTVIVQVK
jgi:hypothetical protein